MGLRQNGTPWQQKYLLLPHTTESRFLPANIHSVDSHPQSPTSIYILTSPSHSQQHKETTRITKGPLLGGMGYH